MNLADYLRRIGYDGPTRPELATLQAVTSAHATAIPWEIFDIFLKRRVTTDPEAAFDKIVGEGRGGWCYENNGLLGLALAEMGFEVVRMTAGGDHPAAHLTLRVETPDAGWFVCDPGLSDSPLYPFALAEGGFEQNGFEYRLELPGEDRFRFVNHRLGLIAGFEARPADEAAMAEASDWLQGSPESKFVNAPIVCIHEPDGAVQALAGRTLRTVRPNRIDSHLVGSADEYLAILKDTFKLDLPAAADFWPLAVRAHQAHERRKAAEAQA